MNEALEDEDLKDMYILLDLRSDRFKDMRWEINHGVSGCRVTDIVFEGACLSIRWDSMEFNTTGE